MWNLITAHNLLPCVCVCVCSRVCMCTSVHVQTKHCNIPSNSHFASFWWNHITWTCDILAQKHKPAYIKPFFFHNLFIQDEMSPSRRSVQSGRASIRWRRASWGVRGMSSGIRLRPSTDGRRSGTRSGQQPWLQSATTWSWLRPSWTGPVSLCHMVRSHRHKHTHTREGASTLVWPLGCQCCGSSGTNTHPLLIILRMMPCLFRDYCWSSYVIATVACDHLSMNKKPAWRK